MRGLNSARGDDNRISPGNTSHSKTRGFLIRIFHLIINNFLNTLPLPRLSPLTALAHFVAEMFGKKIEWKNTN